MSLFFVAVSLLSITLAWFAYSGIANTATEVDVKAWYIEFSKNNETVSNEVVLSLNDIYPGMETVTEKIDVKNLGDTDAKIDLWICATLRNLAEAKVCREKNFFTVGIIIPNSGWIGRIFWHRMLS